MKHGHASAALAKAVRARSAVAGLDLLTEEARSVAQHKADSATITEGRTEGSDIRWLTRRLLAPVQRMLPSFAYLNPDNPTSCTHAVRQNLRNKKKSGGKSLNSEHLKSSPSEVGTNSEYMYQIIVNNEYIHSKQFDPETQID